MFRVSFTKPQRQLLQRTRRQVRNLTATCLLIEMFETTFTESAYDDLCYLEKFEQGIILDGIEKQLSVEPATPTRKRKPLRANELSDWELRIGKFRVF